MNPPRRGDQVLVFGFAGAFIEDRILNVSAFQCAAEVHDVFISAKLRIPQSHVILDGEGGLWAELVESWRSQGDDRRPPVFIIVCANTAIAKVVYEWLAENKPPMGIPSAGIPALLNTGDERNTIRVDSKVVSETDSGRAKSDEAQWLRFMLDTVGKTAWPMDRLGRPIYPGRVRGARARTSGGAATRSGSQSVTARGGEFRDSRSKSPRTSRASMSGVHPRCPRMRSFRSLWQSSKSTST